MPDEYANPNFVGRVLGLRSIIGFHGRTVEELRAELASAVADSVADCQERGVSPERPAFGKLLLRVPPEIHSKALIRAQANGKSLNQSATEALERAVQADGQPGIPVTGGERCGCSS